MMEANIESPSFIDVEKALTAVDAATGAAETHGILCGVICAGNAMDGKAWLQAIESAVDADFEQSAANRDILLALYKASSEQLKGMDFDFNLMLPDDESPLGDRAQALSDWCQGFLYGLGVTGIDLKDGVSEDSQEAIYHMSEISQLDFDTIEATNEDENSYTEVAEYVRMGVLMLHSEFAEKQVRAINDQGGSGQLH